MQFRVLLAAAVAAFLSASPLPSSAAAVSDAAAVISRHAAFVGHPEGLVLSYRYTPSAKLTPAPKPSPGAADAASSGPPPRSTATTYRRGELYREVDEFSGVSEQSGFTGRAFWSSNMNGYTVIDLDDAARRMLTSNIIEGDLLNANVKAVSRGTQTVGGVEVDVVRITPESGIPADVSFDRKTGAYVQIAYDPDDPDERSVVHIDGYVEAAPGIHVVSAFHTSEYGSWELTDKAVRAVVNEDLRGPLPTAKWTFASTEASPIEIVEHQLPYAFLPRGHAVHVRASIGGHVGTFLLDSGAGEIILYRPYADKLKYTTLGRTGFRGVSGGGVGAHYVRLADPIEVGKNSLANVVVAVADGGFGDIDGILGYDFLAGALVDVDTAASTIRILDPSVMEPTVASGAYAFPVNLASHQPGISLRASGVPTRAVFDTGDDYLAVLSDDLQSSGRIVSLTDQIHIGGGATVDYRISFFGVDGPGNVPVKCSRLDELDVGPYKYVGVETCFASAKVFGRDGGLIGFDFLKHFNWTFDYVDSKLVLTPNGK